MHTLDLINDEHVELLTLSARIRVKSEKKNLSDEEKSDLVSSIAHLLTIVEQHFADEEQMMKEMNYFDYDGHTAAHNGFLDMAKKLFATLEYDISYLPDVARIFDNWITTHIEIETFLFVQVRKQVERQQYK